MFAWAGRGTARCIIMGGAADEGVAKQSPLTPPWWLVALAQSVPVLALLALTFPGIPTPLWSALFMLWMARGWSVQAVGGALCGGEGTDEAR